MGVGTGPKRNTGPTPWN